jgi:hypothetical protein
VDDPPDACLTRRVEQHGRVLDGLLEAVAAMREANPVGVVERLGSGQCPGQRRAVCELQQRPVDPAAERVAGGGVGSGQAPYLPPAGQELLGDERAGVRERPRNDV